MKGKYNEISVDRLIVMTKMSIIFGPSQDLQVSLFEELVNLYTKYGFEKLSVADFIKKTLNVVFVFIHTHKIGESFVNFQFKDPNGAKGQKENTNFVHSHNFILCSFSKLEEVEKVVLFCYLNQVSLEGIEEILGTKHIELLNTISNKVDVTKLSYVWEEWSQDIKISYNEVTNGSILQHDYCHLFYQIGGAAAIGTLSFLIYKYLQTIEFEHLSKNQSIIGILFIVLSLINVSYYILHNFILKYTLKKSQPIVQTLNKIYKIIFRNIISEKMLWFTLPISYIGVVVLGNISSNTMDILKTIGIGITLFIIACKKFHTLNNKR